jgi:hypothetical protein
MAPKKANDAKKEAQAAKAKAKQKASAAADQVTDDFCCYCWRGLQLTSCLLPAQAAEDKTFGLKNKGKSAKVQK